MQKKGREAKPHIGIYGKRNYGKSSFINRLAGQEIAIVSEVPGTTTDPVKKSFEITGFGPVILLDTAGIDDEGELGTKRIQKTFSSIDTIDLAILLIAHNEFGAFEQKLINRFRELDVPYLIIHSKSDEETIKPDLKAKLEKETDNPLIEYDNIKAENLQQIIDLIRITIPESSYKSIFSETTCG